MKYSRQRSVILDIMKNRYDHPTADDVYDTAHRRLPDIGIATVYRNLNRLAESGEIIRIQDPDGHDRFDGHTEEHYHMRCPVCGRLEDLYADDPGKIRELIRSAKKVFGIEARDEVVLRSVIMECVCDECRTKRKIN